MSIFFKPRDGVCADFIPYYENGTYYPESVFLYPDAVLLIWTDWTTYERSYQK